MLGVRWLELLRRPWKLLLLLRGLLLLLRARQPLEVAGRQLPRVGRGAGLLGTVQRREPSLLCLLRLHVGQQHAQLLGGQAGQGRRAHAREGLGRGEALQAGLGRSTAQWVMMGRRPPLQQMPCIGMHGEGRVRPWLRGGQRPRAGPRLRARGSGPLLGRPPIGQHRPGARM